MGEYNGNSSFTLTDKLGWCCTTLGVLRYLGCVFLDVFPAGRFTVVTGVSGAGKSTLLDAITWALWGQARAKRDDELISQGEGEMRVSLVFEEGTNTYQVIRTRKLGKATTRNKAPASTGSLDLLVEDKGLWRTLNETRQTDTQAKIINLLNLNYETFINSAFLKQGRADELLQGSMNQLQQENEKLDAEKSLIECLLELADHRLARSAHDCAEGGLAVCLAESAMADPLRPLGLEVALEDELHGAPLLFGETAARAVVSCAPDQVEAVLDAARRHDVPARRIGTVGPVNGRFVVRTATAPTIDAPIGELRQAWVSSIPRAMERAVEV